MKLTYKRAVLMKNAVLCWRTAARAQYPAAWEQRMWLTLLFWAQEGEGL